MFKVGILSIFDNRSMGNRLQNYALQYVIENDFADTLTIKNKPYAGKCPWIRKRRLAEAVWFNRLLGMRKRAELAAFTNKNIHLSENSYWYDKTLYKLQPTDRCDLYCAGSDQVWNPHMGRTGMFNYLGFADWDRTFSYAASFGVEEIPEQHREAVRKGLDHIKFISVREDAGKRIVEELTGRTDVQVLVDPTMLLTTEEWDAVARKPKGNVPERYVLTYFLGTVSEERRAAIVQKAREMDCQIIELMDKNSPFYAIGPDHFVYLIKHAALVCTDSFHGSVFSFLYQRPLAILDREGNGDNMGSRLKTLSGKFCLEKCMVTGNDLSAVPAEADYSEGYEALKEERKKARAFLNMVFEEAERVSIERKADSIRM